MDKAEVRREYLRQGGDIRATALALGISRPTVYRAIRSLPPLTVPTVRFPGLDPADPDAQAVATYVRGQLDRVGVLGAPESPAPKPPPEADSPDWERVPTED